MSILLELISTLIISIGEVLAWYNICKKKINILKPFNILLLIILTILNFLNYKYLNNFFKGVGTIVISAFISKVILNIKLKDSIILSFIEEFMVIISEALIVIIISFFFNLDMSNITYSLYIQVGFDCIIALCIYFMSKAPIFSKLYFKLSKITDNLKLNVIFVFILFVVFGVTVLFSATYFKEHLQLAVLINIIVAFIYTIIMFLILNYQNRYYKIRLKYKNIIDNLQAHEMIIDNYRVINHENKNQLLTIKSMTNNKKVTNYISSLLKQKEIFNNEVISETLKLPEGGIRGLIYSKITQMKNNGIECNLNVDKKIKSSILYNISDNDNVEICEVLGVYIDNAREEVENMEQKIINISLYLEDDKLNIIISNPYRSEKLNNNLKSTKGDGHGYGLQLVKKIISNNKRLNIETRITKDVFTQKLCIKI